MFLFLTMRFITDRVTDERLENRPYKDGWRNFVLIKTSFNKGPVKSGTKVNAFDTFCPVPDLPCLLQQENSSGRTVAGGMGTRLLPCGPPVPDQRLVARHNDPRRTGFSMALFLFRQPQYVSSIPPFERRCSIVIALSHFVKKYLRCII